MTEEHRDQTLDSFVAAWAAPPPDPRFHSRVRRAFDREFVKAPWWRIGKSLLYRLAISALCLATIGLAFPQAARFRLPWLQPSTTIDWETIFYADDGARTFDLYTRTVPMIGANGPGDMVLWKYTPDHPYDNLLEGIRTQANYLSYRITLPFLEDTKETDARTDPNAAYVKSGCIRRDETVLGQETLLGCPTTVVQMNNQQRHMRVKAWRAPDLGCRVLKSTIEVQRPDLTYRLIYEQRALDITR